MTALSEVSSEQATAAHSRHASDGQMLLALDITRHARARMLGYTLEVSILRFQQNKNHLFPCVICFNKIISLF